MKTKLSTKDYVDSRIVYKPMSLAFNGVNTWFDEFANAKMIGLSIKDNSNNAKVVFMDATRNTYQVIDNYSVSGLAFTVMFQVGIGIVPKAISGTNSNNALIIGIYFIY